ncbi:FAD-dependent monooxygenase [Rhodococcoides kyotonense]|uniref:2-polyprenyl-6-methoxyphenol hydroxylase n=1 Tax=Rhodococcoides kyotonense TaxID=398843 RepID=A0A239ILL7_9NOCA|nr:FAD-dependent monooxygenase [Rhodococcus kyotonensis]SNS94439.1 2-polyprenyl-6-methoxyphenol hydroxylase [Rhodococcus kyotonensis]
MRSFDTDVLVVGAGPVGLVLAVDLARRGVATRIIDRRTEPTDESRAVVVHARSLEMLDALGVVERIIDSGRTTIGVQFHADGKVLANIPLDTVDSPYPFSVTTAQTETERILTDRLRTLGVEIERGVELIDLAQDGASVQAFTSTGTITCRYLAGTDGASSTVRHHLGQKLEGSFKGERFLMGDVDATYDLDRRAMHIFASTGGGPALIFPMVGERVRVIAEISEDESDRPASMEWLQQVCNERGLGAQIRSPRWLTTFEIHHAQVPRYRTGRVFLAGDAAHVHSPAGGQGMNTGMQDAFNLGWKLGSAVAGTASETLLDSYHLERHPVAAHVITETTALTRAATIESKVARGVRNRILHVVGGRELVQHRIADEMEEYSVSYSDSPIVRKGLHAHVTAGESARAVEGTELWSYLINARRIHPSDHVLLVVQADAQPISIPGTTAISVWDDEIAKRYGMNGIVLIRPDGYIATVTRADDIEGIESTLALAVTKQESVL